MQTTILNVPQCHQEKFKVYIINLFQKNFSTFNYILLIDLLYGHYDKFL